MIIFIKIKEFIDKCNYIECVMFFVFIFIMIVIVKLYNLTIKDEKALIKERFKDYM